MWKKDLKTLLLLLLCMLLWAVVYNMLTSCTRTVQKLVETHDTVYVEKQSTDTLTTHETATDTVYVARTDTVVRTDIRRDSVVVRDSVFVREKGDTLYIYKERWRERLVMGHDTVFRVKTDTVLKTKTDTLTIYRFVERKDSANVSSSDKEKQVKERRTFGWLKVLGLLVAVLAGIAVWLKLKK